MEKDKRNIIIAMAILAIFQLILVFRIFSFSCDCNCPEQEECQQCPNPIIMPKIP